MQRIRDLFKDESGASAVEYGLLVALISLVLIGAVTALGQSISGMFTYVNAGVAAATGS